MPLTPGDHGPVVSPVDEPQATPSGPGAGGATVGPAHDIVTASGADVTEDVSEDVSDQEEPEEPARTRGRETERNVGG